MSVPVRRVRSEHDVAALLQLLIEYERSLPVHLRHGPEPSVRSAQGIYADRNAAFLALRGDVAAGCVAVARLDETLAVIRRLYVRPDCRRDGMARALVGAAIEFCRDEGYERIVLDTARKQLPAAYALYLSMGFTPCSAFAAVGYDDPTFMDMRF